MSLRKVKIENFKVFESFELDFNEGLNILVGDNEVGKSTILEAIHLALTGMINGKYLNTELTQYLFNNSAVKKYLDGLSSGDSVTPPQIKIELFFNEHDDLAALMGGINSDRDKDAYGLACIIELESTSEYEELLKAGNIKTLPIEYYDVKWITFADKPTTAKSIPVKSAMVDSSLARFQNGSDIYISRIVRQSLEPSDSIKIAQAHRNMLEGFMSDPSVGEINKKISDNAHITERAISLSVELLSKNAWESSLVTCVDSVPFHYIGKGEQCVIKTRLALSDKKTKEASIVMIEEPENHLTHARLNQLLDIISSECEGRQVIVSTHSSFVANKLGLENIILLNSGGRRSRLTDLKDDTPTFFKKLPGYDTLRLVLSKCAILVEGASDELVVQKAYMISHDGRLPITDGIDIISVGTSFLRFMEIASRLNKRISIVTDNDGDIGALETKYKDYIGDNSQENIFVSYDKENHTPSESPIPEYNYNTLENLVLKANGLADLNTILGKQYNKDDDLRKYMRSNKTECALAVFEYTGNVKFPDYIVEAIKHVCQ
jgi:putative ATP-dependent endonuclease of OLD family